MWIEGVRKRAAEENTCAQERGSKRRMEDAV
jgi:hypothetical protein